MGIMHPFSISIGKTESVPVGLEDPLEEITLFPALIISPDTKAGLDFNFAHCRLLGRAPEAMVVIGSAIWGPLVKKWLRGESHAH